MLTPKLKHWFDTNDELIPRRLLLSGSSGTLEQGIELAKTLQNTSEERIRSGIHSDTIVFLDNKKSFKIDYSSAAQKDGQSEVENVRGLIKWMHTTPQEGPYRIAILEGLERLSRESPHALLKLIEEPPKNAFLIFTTKNHHQILDTILSRVTVVRLPQLSHHPERRPKDEAEGSHDLMRSAVPQFLRTTNTIDRFKIIDQIDSESKKTKDRSLFINFAEEVLQTLRANQKHQDIPLVYETYLAINRNQNPKFCLERMALGLK